MGFPWILLIAIPFHLDLTTAQYSEELYVVENPTTGELTCMSENDDAALVWNYDLSTNRSSADFDFRPAKLLIDDIFRCAVWRSTECLARWKSDNNWPKADSLLQPMGPVVDYRWEDFTEYVISRVTGQGGYFLKPHLASLVNGTVVFSVRGTRDIKIRLCGDDDPKIDPCFVIKVAVDGQDSTIQNCVRNQSVGGNGECETLDVITDKTIVLDAHEWRTFRFQWISGEKKIMFFSDTNKTALLQGNVQEWHSVRTVWFETLSEARIKFYGYTYFLATSQLATRTTQRFSWYGTNFCFNILVSLCPECHIKVSIVDNESDNELAIEHIRGDQDFDPNRLRIWRSVKLNMILHSLPSNPIKLKLECVPNGNQNPDVWCAIDSLRICEQNSGVRESTVKLSSLGRRRDGSDIKCQKLFHSKIVSADSSTTKPSSDINHLRECIRQRTQIGDTQVPLAVGNVTIYGVIIAILVICSLILIVFLWYRRHGEPPVEMSHSQNVPVDKLYATIPADSTAKTRDSRDVLSDPPYMIPINLKAQTRKPQDLPVAPLYSNIRDNPRKQKSHSQDVPLDGMYATVPENSKEQTSCSENISLSTLYTEIPRNSGVETSYVSESLSDSQYLIILDN